MESDFYGTPPINVHFNVASNWSLAIKGVEALLEDTTASRKFPLYYIQGLFFKLHMNMYVGLLMKYMEENV